MVISPFVGGGDSNTKLAIIHILNRYKSLNAKKIFNLLKKDFAISITYQACHKALKKMYDDKVLDYIDKEYLINDSWVSKMKNFVSDLEKTPSKMIEVFTKLDQNKIVSFDVRNEAEMGYFVLDFMEHYSETGGNGPLIMNMHFVWTILPLSDEQFVILKSLIKRHGVYIMAREGKEYDKIMKRHWEDAGGKVDIGIKDAVSNCDVICIGDYIINIYWDPDHLEEAVNSTKQIKKESDLNYNELYELICKPVKIDFVIMKNKEAAESIRNKTLGHFRK
ncbi:MAG: hypothetical protein KKE20_05680 [Nanoarchaeota archaeon]|nr:hypothetical protein [Nanoarchaeota archaeon]